MNHDLKVTSIDTCALHGSDGESDNLKLYQNTMTWNTEYNISSFPVLKEWKSIQLNLVRTM